jgi:antitoxin component YwqK of YwqJK toxin-antitoxin module
MRILNVLVLLLLTVEIIGCKQEKPKSVIPENSAIVSTFSDGKPKLVKVFDVMEGEKVWVKEIQFHKNGTKSMEGRISNGLREGEWISWYADGKVWSKGSFKNGLREGRGLVYYPNGQVQIDGYYENGERSGLWKSWDEHGKLISETDYTKSE